jgi:hypothetical protein
MSRGRFPQFNSAARSFLEADPGPVDDESCGVGQCDLDAVYRVPWHSVGGDIAYCRVESRLGVHEWDDEIEQTLLGGELA